MTESFDNLDEELNISAEEFMRVGKANPLPEGTTCYFKVIEADRGQRSNGSKFFQVKVAPLADPTDSSSIMIDRMMYHSVLLPIRNREVAGHRAPNTAGFMREFLRALYGDTQLPRGPRWDKQRKVAILDGKDLTQAEAEALYLQASEKAVEKMKALWKNPEQMEGQCFVATIRKDDRGYIGLTRLLPEPDGSTVLTNLTTA